LFGTLIDNYPMKQSAHVLTEMATVLSLPGPEFISLWTVRTWPMRASGEFVDLDSCIMYISHVLKVPVVAEKVNSLVYLSETEMLHALGIADHQQHPFCNACFTGCYPTQLHHGMRIHTRETSPELVLP